MITLHEILRSISKFLHLRRMEEKIRSQFFYGLNPNGTDQLLDYRSFNPEKTIIFDVDKTILIAYNRDYVNAEPIQPMIKKINRLYAKGYTIILFSARGQLSRNGSMWLIETEVRPILEEWLHRHDVKYDYLRFCKPYGAWYVDDKALTLDEFLGKDFD